jgi:holo-[acyl-carrier protein] synthase
MTRGCSATIGSIAARVTGVGIDLLEIDRLERALSRRPRLAERLFTADERAYAAGRGRPVQHLAARFCAKEAVAKALGLEAWNPHDVEVVPTGAAPAVRLSGHAARRAAELGVEVRLSLTHSRGMAGAVAVAE